MKDDNSGQSSLKITWRVCNKFSYTRSELILEYETKFECRSSLVHGLQCADSVGV
jgi:hypothetical protein